MPQLIEFTVVECTPDLKALLRRETGVAAPPARLARLYDDGLQEFDRLATPQGVIRQVTVEEFEDIYGGDGRNAPSTPLEEIYPNAQRLALFAATVGDGPSNQIGALFKRGEPALGYALDVIASEATNMLADRLSLRFLGMLRDQRAGNADTRVLPYSPGYCGWHISGQRRLFESLHARKIGMTLSESFLMRPLKSVSGVLVAGPAAVHRFRPVYPFCEDCTTHECRGRMASVLRAART
jgi:cobalamin-dependent methionine synthase-like protein